VRTGQALLGAVVTSTMLATIGSGATAPAAAAPAAPAAASAEYVVLYRTGQGSAAARADIAKAGGTVVRENTKVGYALVRSANATFTSAAASSAALEGAARNRIIGTSPKGARARADAIERLPSERAATRGTGGLADAPARSAAPAGVAPEPLADRQWNMRQMGATPAGSYAKNQGSHGVRVGVIDTGIDGTHPDIAPNFDRALSHNFVTDNPFIDGPCEVASCVDPADVDDFGHGTLVASLVGAPVNELGIAGVAPKVSLVNIRAGQDSGYLFLQPILDALTYAGDIGVDVVNLSFFVDPWVFNCLDNPADSPAEQAEQRVIRTATQRALNYALSHGVLPIAAMANEATDLGKPTDDDISPDFPPGTAKHRDIDNSCIMVPTESSGVVGVSSTGPSTRKAYYSNYGVEQTDIAAPGGDAYDGPDNTFDERNRVLAAYPARLAQLAGQLNPDGTPNTPLVVRDCKAGVCGYYQYQQGTSLAAPHATGVAALVVSRLGVPDATHGGKKLAPNVTRAKLFSTAVSHACPQPRLLHYKRIQTDGTVAEDDHFCAGPIEKNGFYGRGIVNAYRAATTR